MLAFVSSLLIEPYPKASPQTSFHLHYSLSKYSVEFTQSKPSTATLRTGSFVNLMFIPWSLSSAKVCSHYLTARAATYLFSHSLSLPPGLITPYSSNFGILELPPSSSIFPLIPILSFFYFKVFVLHNIWL